ncbi:MAG: hypothetical protein QXR53_01210 [Candidatus Norongarragalinales archaeon]
MDLRNLDKDKLLVYALLFIAVVTSLHSHSMVWKEWYYPTYGNTNIHVAFAQHILKHGEYPLQNDYSYGGGIPALYVPGYRLLLAGTTFVLQDVDFAQRMLVMLFAILLPIGFFLFAREVFDDFTGLAAAFFASLPAELLIYTVRPLPQGLGLALLPFAFYAIARNKRKTALLLTFAIAMVHQETIAFLAAGAFAFAALKVFSQFAQTRKVAMPSESAWTALLCWALALIAYVGWHFIATGNANIFDIAQFSNHEGNPVGFDLFLEKNGLVLTAGSVLGFVLLAARNFFQPRDRELLLIALALAGFAFIKNDLVGVRVFMDRFIVFLQVPLVVLAAFAFKQLADYAMQLDLKTMFPRRSE